MDVSSGLPNILMACYVNDVVTRNLADKRGIANYDGQTLPHQIVFGIDMSLG